jgi:cbb3-type cytochrome oxidase maturation protein
MSILFVLVPLSLALVVFAGWAFFWAVGAGQFDDLDSPAWDMLRDADPAGGRGLEAEGRESLGDRRSDASTSSPGPPAPSRSALRG